jgi:hypothetical protein
VSSLRSKGQPLVLIYKWSLVLPDSPIKAKFLNHDEKIIALERLRANNQVRQSLGYPLTCAYIVISKGTETKVWKWEQVWDLLLDPKTYLWFLLLFVCACVPLVVNDEHV